MKAPTCPAKETAVSWKWLRTGEAVVGAAAAMFQISTDWPAKAGLQCWYRMTIGFAAVLGAVATLIGTRYSCWSTCTWCHGTVGTVVGAWYCWWYSLYIKPRTTPYGQCPSKSILFLFVVSYWYSWYSWWCICYLAELAEFVQLVLQSSCHVSPVCRMTLPIWTQAALPQVATKKYLDPFRHCFSGFYILVGQWALLCQQRRNAINLSRVHHHHHHHHHRHQHHQSH